MYKYVLLGMLLALSGESWAQNRTYHCPDPRLIQTTINNNQTQFSDQGITFTIKNPKNIKPKNLTIMGAGGSHPPKTNTFRVVCTYYEGKMIHKLSVEADIPDPISQCVISGGVQFFSSHLQCDVTCP
jgi:hypothetical protein